MSWENVIGFGWGGFEYDLVGLCFTLVIGVFIFF